MNHSHTGPHPDVTPGPSPAGNPHWTSMNSNASSTDSATSTISAHHCDATAPLRFVAALAALLCLLGMVAVTIQTLTEHQTITVESQ